MKRPAIPSKLMLLEDRRSGGAARAPATAVRRFRLARLRLEGTTRPATGRFDYLKRAYD